MTDDQQFILALATLIVPTLATVLTYRKTDQTHKAVNGIQVKAVRAARAKGRAAGVKAGQHAPGWGKPPSGGTGGLS